MKYLVIYSHPNPKSFCHAILETATKELSSRNGEVVVRDLYALKFDPVLKPSDFSFLQAGKAPADVKEEQDFVRAADMMIFIYPVWWTGLPAMTKGYIDRVYSHSFAFAIEATGAVGLLKGKKTIIFNTQGTPGGIYETNGLQDAMKKTSDAGIFQFCGIEVLNHTFFPAVPSVSDAVRKGYLEEVAKVIRKYC